MAAAETGAGAAAAGAAAAAAVPTGAGGGSGRRGSRCRHRCLQRRHQRSDLRPRQRPSQVRHRPARLEHLGRVLVHVVEQEDAIAERRDQLLELRAIEPALARGALEPVQHALLVLVGLQAPDQPGAGVGEALVVEVDGVLGRQHDAQPERARLLEQRQQRLLGGRLRGRREVAEDLVHVEQRAQAGRARLAAHPGQHGVQQQRHEEHALGVREVRDREDRDAGLAGVAAQQLAHVERHALHPELEARRGEQVVERQRQLEAILLRVERVEIEHADLGERRLLDLGDERGDVERLAVGPRGAQDAREQDVLAALDRVGVDPEQRQQAGRDRADLIAHGLRVGAIGGRREGAQHRDGQAGVAARGVDGEVGGVAQALDTRTVLAPVCEALGPHLSLRLREVVGRGAGLGGVVLVDPRAEVLRAQRREGEHEIGQVALGVDHDRRHAVERCLLDDADAQPRLARAGHADAHGVRGQILRVVEDVAVLQRLGLDVVRLAEVEAPKSFDLIHGASPRLVAGQV